MTVLIDRIACSGDGERRTSRVEYKKFLANRGKYVPDLTSLPAPGVRFTDRCHVLNWRPQERLMTQGVVDSRSPDSSDSNDDNVNNNLPGESGCVANSDKISDGQSLSDSEFESGDETSSEDEGTSEDDTGLN